MKPKSNAKKIVISSLYVLSNVDVFGNRKYVSFFNTDDQSFLYSKDYHMAQTFELDEVRCMVETYSNLKLSATLATRL